MHLISSLQQRYQQIVEAPLKDGVVESVSLLFCNDWVRIMIIRDSQLADVCSMEVELSMPSCVIDPSPTESKSQQELAVRFIGQMISHLEYLLKLKESGFLLCILSTDCVWSASMDIQECPGRSFFEMLIPPS
jgi:hypothetical protein